MGRTVCDRLVVFKCNPRLIGQFAEIAIYDANAHTMFGNIVTRPCRAGTVYAVMQMKGLSFNLRTLFLATTLLAVIVYISWRVRQHRPVGEIPAGMFALQVEQDDAGLLFTITASTEAIENVVIELEEVHPNYATLNFGTGLIAVEPCERKRVRVQRNPGQLPSVEMQDLLPIVRLPSGIGNGLTELRLPYHRADYYHLGYVRDGKSLNFQNERSQKYRLTILINQTAREAVLP